MESPAYTTNNQQPNGHPPNGKQQAARLSLERTSDGRPRFQGCSSLKAYEVLSKLGEGTFGEVHKARSRRTGGIVALKKILLHNEKDGFPITALREIKLLKMLSHPNILKLEEMAVEHKKGEAAKRTYMHMVTPYMDHDLSGLLENPAVRFTEPQIKCYMLQLLEGLRYLHENQILHRDMKAANLLINNHGILQIADFGLARPYDDPPPEPGKGGGEATRDYTTLVVTRWYRPPELLLQLRRYTTAIDMWGVGCVFGEMFKGRPILAGSTDLNQAYMIFDLVGSPTEETMPGWTSLPGMEGMMTIQSKPGAIHQVFREQGSAAISLLTELLKLDWRKRINAIDAIEHPYFKNHPLPAKPGEIPQFEDSHELDRRKFRGQKAAPPPAPAGGTVGMGPNGDFGHGLAPPHQHHQRPRGGSGYFQNGQTQNQPRRNNYDHRYPAPQRDYRDGLSHGQPPHRPAWARDSHGLPPRPPPPADMGRSGPGQGWPAEVEVHPPPRSRMPQTLRNNGGGGPSNRDTYVPSYANRDNRDHRYRDRDDAPRHGERGDRGHPVDRRDFEARDPGRRRSRSPDPHRDRARHREPYRR